MNPFKGRHFQRDIILCLLPGQTGSSLPEKGLNTATGAAGEGCNEKAAFITPGIQKAE